MAAGMAQIEEMRCARARGGAGIHAWGEGGVRVLCISSCPWLPCRRKLEADRAAVEAQVRWGASEEPRSRPLLTLTPSPLQMARMGELGRRVKEDSERLVEQARSLRSAAVHGGGGGGGGAAASPLAFYDDYDGGSSVATGTTMGGGGGGGGLDARFQRPSGAALPAPGPPQQHSVATLAAAPPPRASPAAPAAADSDAPLPELYDAEVRAPLLRECGSAERM